MEREVKFLGKLLGEVDRPFVAIIGGAKVSDKIGVLENLLARVNQILIGGAMANTFLKAKGGHLGRSLVEEDKLALARSFLRKADAAAGRRAAPARPRRRRRHQVRVGPRGERDGGARGSRGARHRPGDGARLRRRDLAREDHPVERPDGSVRIGPVRGRNDRRRQGGRRQRSALSVVGGGDSVAAVHKAGVADKITHISTGGGASLELLEGKKLPGLAALES